uniref:Uncharacterized protein n=1 Tax=Caenorhabditis tropicalis TaxID=1561998 RepID=A0A1I7U9R1_9PELO
MMVVREPSVDLSVATDTLPVSQSIEMIPERKETKQIRRRKSRNQLIKSYVIGFSMGFIFCVIVFSICMLFWKWEF